MLVLQESFWNKETISFYKQVLPIIGLITAAINFSTNVGIAFAANKVYVFFDDFKSKTLTNKVDDYWLQYFKKLIVDSSILPEDWQHMGRMNSATYLYDKCFNLPSQVK